MSVLRLRYDAVVRLLVNGSVDSMEAALQSAEWISKTSEGCSNKGPVSYIEVSNKISI